MQHSVGQVFGVVEFDGTRSGTAWRAITVLGYGRAFAENTGSRGAAAECAVAHDPTRQLPAGPLQQVGPLALARAEDRPRRHWRRAAF